MKVGRAALAPDVIRAIEESNPGLRFDWDKILKVKPPPPPDPGREEREERRNRRRRGKEAGAGGAARPAGADATRQARKAASPSAPAEKKATPDGVETDETPAAHAVADVTVDDDQSPRHVALALTDEEGLARLRARHAEIQTRIGDRFRDPARLEELRSQAAQLDPDGWGSIEEARERIASMDETTAALRKILGRRRRTRRGGARRRRGPAGESGAPTDDAVQARSEPDEAAPPDTPAATDTETDPTAT